MIIIKKKYDIQVPRSEITKEDVLRIINYSIENNIPEKLACEKLGFNHNYVNYYTKKKFSIKPHEKGKAPFTYRIVRKYSINDNFFSIPNELNCYYAGFFAADGCVNKNKKMCSIALSIKDLEWLKQFKKDLEYTGEIKCRKNKDNVEYCDLSFTSPKIVEDLEKNFNITPVKTLILKHPDLKDSKLIDAFICGYLDGDGCVSLKNSSSIKQKVLSISAVGTLDICSWIKKRFDELTNTVCGHYYKRNNIYIYNITNKQARKIFEIYYQLNLPKLERKWSKEKHEYCVNFKKTLPTSRRKGVYVYNLNGKLIKWFNTLSEASKYTGISEGRISNLCKLNDNNHKAGDFMFNRTGNKIDPYIPKYCINKKYL